MSFFYFKRRIISAAFILAAIVFTACSLFDEKADQELVTISLPDWPPQRQSDETNQPVSYPPLSRWKITLAKNDETIVFHTAGDTQLEVSIQKNCPFSIQAAPVTLMEDGQECLYFHPAGFIYPFSSENKADWKEGYTAFIMEGLYRNCKFNGLTDSQAARYVSTFNWGKFNSLIQEKLDQSCLEDKKFYNPWLCDSTKIIKNLSDESFRSSLLTPSGCYQFSVKKLYETTELSLLSPFIPENSFISIKGQITIKKDYPMLLSDAKKSAVFISYISAKNIHIEYIYIPIYKGEI